MQNTTENPPFIRLSELSAKVSAAVKNAFSDRTFWVLADVTSHTFKSQSNYHYFELIEKDRDSHYIVARFMAKAWGAGAQKIAGFEQATGQRFCNDIHVLVCVAVDFHATYGLQLTLTDIDPGFTLGALEQQRRLTLGRLVTENPGHVVLSEGRYLTFNNRLRLNGVIQRIAVISSDTSAGLQDFRHTLENNGYCYRFGIDVYPAMVHGESRARQFVDKMVEVYQSGIPYDALVIVRGGGAQSDLLMFNDYSIGRAIARFPVPVITGIGHQRNETIADLMAHTATKTPTQAAEFIIAHNRSFENAMVEFQKTIIIKSQQLFSGYFQQLSDIRLLLAGRAKNYLELQKSRLVQNRHSVARYARSVLFSHQSRLVTLSSVLSSAPGRTFFYKKKEMEQMKANLRYFSTSCLRNENDRLHHYASVIRLMSPASIMRRGFAVVKVGGRIAAGADDIQKDKEISVLFANSEIKARVRSKKEYNGTDFNI